MFPPLRSKGGQRVWDAQRVLVQKHLLAAMSKSKLLETGGVGVLHKNPPASSPKEVSGYWTHKASLYRNTCWPPDSMDSWAALNTQ